MFIGSWNVPRASLERAIVFGLLALLLQTPRVTTSLQFRLVTGDPEDNTFMDCAITAGAGTREYARPSEDMTA